MVDLWGPLSNILLDPCFYVRGRCRRRNRRFWARKFEHNVSQIKYKTFEIKEMINEFSKCAIRYGICIKRSFIWRNIRFIWRRDSLLFVELSRPLVTYILQMWMNSTKNRNKWKSSLQIWLWWVIRNIFRESELWDEPAGAERVEQLENINTVLGNQRTSVKKSNKQKDEDYFF